MTFDQERLEHAFAVAQGFVDGGQLPVAALGVATSETTTTRAFGKADDGGAVTDDQLFLLASISKPITGLAIMRLVEQGKLLLDRPVSQVIPEVAAPGKPDITPWHLMTHTSGLPDLPWQYTGREQFGRAELVARSHAAVPQFRPGSRWQYNTLTFYLLGQLVERLDGRDLVTFLREEILEPIGATRIGFDPQALGGAFVTPTNITPRPDFPADEALRILTESEMPGAGFWADMNSLLGLGQALLRDARDGQARVLARPTLEWMTRLHTAGIPKYELDATTPGRYGLTWHKPTTTRDFAHPGSESAFSHSGATGTVLWIDPEYDLSVVFLTNVWGIGDDWYMRCLQAVYAAWRP
ncbi:MAG TPA: serine hydrolase domain-containing protein [Thermomicrobiales bacterium]|nr:serine hydrolase domain-containing protein [Thermomicrobiales bacterium]